MTTTQRERLGRQLLEERRANLEDLAEYDERAREALQNEDGDLTGVPFHPADQAGDTEASELSFAVAERERKTLVAIGEPLDTRRGPSGRGGSDQPRSRSARFA